EPELHVGSNEVTRLYAPLLANLSEWHRILQRRSWGLTASAAEQERAAQLRKELAIQGVETNDDPIDDPLISVDRHNSTFIYRESSRLVQLTAVPGVADLQRD